MVFLWPVVSNSRGVGADSLCGQGLVKEFLESGDASEVSRCWRDLHVPFFSHQLVFAILLADFGTPAAHIKLFNLLGRLLDSGEISEVIVCLLLFMA